LKLSTRGRYATRALVDLASHWGEGPVPLKDVAQRQEVSLNYLEHLVTPLIIAGLMRSYRGPAGGVELARPPADIRLSEIIRLVEGNVEPVDCVGDPAICARSAGCVTRDVWVELERAVMSVLDSVTLQDLAERQKKKDESPGAKKV
jgi:Rrf2 family cysteine metabolism transcriptional repressor